MTRFLPKEVRKTVLSQITPTEEEIRHQTQLIKTLRNALEEKASIVEQSYVFIEPQGSTGKKQTQLRGASDIDMFVALNPSDHENIIEMSRKERTPHLDELMDSLIESWFMPVATGLAARNIQKTYSQHPYLSLTINGYDIDIVGCFDTSPEHLRTKGPITAMDRTVHHSNFVAKEMTDKLREDVRILKSLVRASHSYADTCAIGQMGFTGYSLELLVISKRNLRGALDAIVELENRPIDPENRSLDVLREIPAFRDDPIFIIDPTDTSRNTASSFSSRAHKMLKLKISELYTVSEKNPAKLKDIILERDIPKDPVPNWFSRHCYIQEYSSDGNVHYTVLRDKLYRLARKVASGLEREATGEPRFGQVLFEVFFERQRFAVGFIFEHAELSEYYHRRGPPTSLKEGVEAFVSGRTKTFERDGYVWSEEKRSWRSAKALIQDRLNEKDVFGITLAYNQTDTGAKLLNLLYLYIYPLEGEFLSNEMKEFKENPDAP